MRTFHPLSKADIVKYLRELSIVIIGVLATLLITNIISNRIKSNEVKKAITILRTELEDNLRNINEAEQKWKKEQDIFALIKKHIFQLEKIPEHTLEGYKKVIGDKHSLSVNSDSYEVLKSSLLIQYIKDQDFLRKLSKTYGTIDLLNRKVQYYSDLKKNGLDHLINHIDQKGLEKWINGNTYDFFNVPLNDNVFRAFVYNGNTLISPDEFEKCKNEIISLINRIDKREY